MNSEWVQEARRHVLRGKHIVLHGNVHDAALVDDVLRYPFDMALSCVLRGAVPQTSVGDMPYRVIVWHSLTDGLHCMTAEETTRYREILSAVRSRRPVPAVSATDENSADAENAGGDSGHNETAGATARRRPQDILQELELIRDLIAVDHHVPTAFVLSFAEKLVASEDNQDFEERKAVTLIKQAAERAYRYPDGEHRGLRNLLVLVVSKLGQVSPWVYRENPHFSPVAIPFPNASERQRYVSENVSRFRHLNEGTEAQRNERIEHLCRCTTGFSFLELQTLGLASQREEELSAREPDRMVTWFRYRPLDDPWKALSGWSFDEVERTLNDTVFGQAPAVRASIDSIVRAAGGISFDPPASGSTRPKGVLFLAGPTGVGKTELAKCLGKLIFGDASRLIRFDMSEYKESHDGTRLAGAPPSYVGYQEGGQLTNQLKTNPFCVLLFDEIEKAHPSVLDKFLQILDDGRLTDGMGETVSFEHSLIIFTSNEGSASLRNLRDPGYEQVRETFQKAVAKAFIDKDRPELLGRIGSENIIVFDILRPPVAKRIFAKFTANIVANALRQYELALEIDASVEAECLKRIIADPTLGGRSVRNFINAELLPPINRFAVGLHNDPSSRRAIVRWSAFPGAVVVERT